MADFLVAECKDATAIVSEICRWKLLREYRGTNISERGFVI